MKQYLSIALFLISGILNGQETKFEKYSWNTIPEDLKNDTVTAVGGVKFTFERRIKEVYLNKENAFEEINVFHRRIKVETNNAIDNYNKIYVPVKDVIEILNIKARFISSNGKITELGEGSIKEVKNLENRGDYRIFAIEGIEKGGEIEYFYSLRTRFDAFQSVRMQGKEPRMNVEVIMTFPLKLSYLIKSYNGFPDFTIKMDDKAGLTVMQVNTAYIPPLAEEKYSNYNSYLMRYESTLSYNTYNSALRAYSFTKVSNNMYNNFFVLTKKEESAIDALAKKLNLKNLSNEEKIGSVENWIKSEISVSDVINENPGLDGIIKYKQTSGFGATRLFVSLFNKMNVPFELVLTCDKTERRFDPDFNGWNYLDDFLIYLPGMDKYIVPDDPDIRCDINAFAYQGEYGLFLHPVNYDENLASMAYKIKKLPVMPCNQSTDSLIIKVSCNFNQLKTDMTIHRALSGALGLSFQAFWRSVDEERHKEIISEVFDVGDKNTDVQTFKVINDSKADIGKKPITFDVNLKANSLLESAGNDFILHVGRTIGTQVEMYQTSERKLPVDIDFLHSFYRKIEFNIPEGYKINNPEEVNMKVEMVENGDVSAYFTSWYEQHGNTIIIYSREVYPELGYPVSSFNQFREVINAAADFNKKKLVITAL